VRSGDSTTKREHVAATAAGGTGTVYARLTYRDKLGDHEHAVVRDQVTIGRGGLTHPVDIRVSTSEDVSREHARIRRDARSGQFYLIDLSTLGTTLNGRHVPRGVEEHDGVKRETGAETALPPRARIGLAETVFLEFEQTGQ
jgi:pSer/pThr/pTyr-binding forkhead associated (FHA) protein